MTRNAIPTDPAKWQTGNRWRKLPYAKGVWAGPFGRTDYLCDRDYQVIAYRDADRIWRRGNGESLRRCAMIEAEHLWTPSKGESPAVSRKTLSDLLSRCGLHHATAWLIEEVGA